MPGSPAINTILPGTNPPPSTRENSSIGSGMRSHGSPSTSDNRRGVDRDPAVWRLGAEVEAAISSTYEFHSPQFGHLPISFSDVRPQFWHTHTVLDLAI